MTSCSDFLQKRLKNQSKFITLLINRISSCFDIFLILSKYPEFHFDYFEISPLLSPVAIDKLI